MALSEEIIAIIVSGMAIAFVFSKYIPFTRLPACVHHTPRKRVSVRTDGSRRPTYEVDRGSEQGKTSDFEPCDFDTEIALVITQARAEGAHQIATRLEAALENQRSRQDGAVLNTARPVRSGRSWAAKPPGTLAPQFARR